MCHKWLPTATHNGTMTFLKDLHVTLPIINIDADVECGKRDIVCGECTYSTLGEGQGDATGG